MKVEDVEADESLFAKRKNHAGFFHVNSVACVVNRETGECLVVRVANCNGQTLMVAMVENIEEGSMMSQLAND